MRFGSVCSGIGAPEAAWIPLGWDCAFVSEIDAFPSAVLAHHHPTIPNLGDFTTIGSEHAGIDLLVGGTPCQAFSVAGLRGGLDDDRGNLALEYCRLAERLRPTWLVWENVPGVLSSGGGRDFGAFLGGLVELGYGFAYRVLDAQYDGVAQRRRRVFVVAHAGGAWQRAAAVLFDSESLSGDLAPSREPGAEPTWCLKASSGRRSAQGLDEAQGHQLVPVVGHTLLAHHGRIDPETETFIPVVAGTLGGPDGTATTQAALQGLAIPVDLAQVTSATNRATCAPGAPAYSLAATSRPAVALMPIRPNVQGTSGPPVRVDGDPMYTLGTNPRDIAVAFNARQDPVSATVSPPLDTDGTTIGVHHGWAVRRLTPREWERLQGFADEFTRIPWRGKPAEQCPDGPRYKAIGNSMSVPTMRWIGERIELVEAIPS